MSFSYNRKNGEKYLNHVRKLSSTMLQTFCIILHFEIIAG